MTNNQGAANIDNYLDEKAYADNVKATLDLLTGTPDIDCIVLETGDEDTLTLGEDTLPGIPE